MNSKVENYLTTKKNDSPDDLSKKFGDLEEYYNKKLWHQLTLALLALVKDPALQQGTELIQLYNNLISELENKINPLSLAQMGGEVVKQYTDPNEGIKFIEKIAPKVVDHQEAKVLCNVLIADITLKRLEDQSRTKKILDETEKMLDEVDGVTPVHGKFYLLASELYCRSGAHSDYYRAALRYLGCTDSSILDDETKSKHAFYLGLAALLGEGIYNFGELLAHPILEVLKGSSSEWLLDLLFVFNQGNINKFETMRPQWSTQMDLVTKENQLREKIRLLCLMEVPWTQLCLKVHATKYPDWCGALKKQVVHCTLITGFHHFNSGVELETFNASMEGILTLLRVAYKTGISMTFQRKAWDRQLTFAEIAKETGLPENQVEVMVMRALSLGLVRGTIDQVDDKVNITWVQPRVLDKKQLAVMMDRLTDWCKDVNSMQSLLQEQASSILTL